MSLIPLWVLLSIICSSGTSSTNEDRKWLVSLIELIEFDYEEHCEQKALASWNELIGTSGSLQQKLEREKAFGIFSRAQTQDVRAAVSAHALSPGDNVLRRKAKLLLEPGDMLLDTEQWIRLVTFGENALHNLRFATDYDCALPQTTNCTLREFERSFASQTDEVVLRRMKSSWESKLPDLNEYRDQILPLLRNATKENNFKTVEEYWDSLAEYEGGLLKARELWDQIKPLYVKLHRYVSLRLRGPDTVGEPLPVHLLRSLNGDDWSNIVETLLPKHPDVYQKLHANLQLKGLGGKDAFKAAAKLIEEMNFGDLDPEIWNDSEYNGTCPTTIIDSCKPNKIKFNTCSDVSIGKFIDAHADVMKIRYKDIVALHSNNTYILREANRHSALYEAIPGFVSLLSLAPHALDRVGLYPLEKFNYRNNANHNRLVLQLILALRDLPRLNYYLAVDEWRLKVLMGTATFTKDAGSWSELRKQFSLLETSDLDFLSSPYVLLNKPHVGQYLGLILKYQIYQSFAEELMMDDSDLIQHVSENNNRVLDVMSRGYEVAWPEMVSDLLAKRENGLEATALTDYFRLLDEYLDSQLDPSSTSNIMSIEFEEPPEETPIENEIPENTIENEPEEIPEKVELEEANEANMLENVVEIGEEFLKHVETSTVGVLEIKNPVTNNENTNDTVHASYSMYWWIGVGIAVAIIVMLIAAIVRKRNNHRKQLDKQRRDTSHA